MGIPLVRMKLAAFAVGASFAGVMGVLLAGSRTFISPESFSFMQSIGVLSMVILGGSGSIPGVILGTAGSSRRTASGAQNSETMPRSEPRKPGAMIPIMV